jgi:hypothetical protein
MVENNFTASSPELRYNYCRANFPKMYAAFQAIVWDDVMHCQDVNSACHLFYTKILRVIDECVPLLKNGVSKYPPWFSKCTINSIVRKGRAWKSYKKTKLQMYKDQAKRIQNDIKKNIRAEYNEFIRSAESRIKSNPTDFWNYINTKKNSTRIPGELYNNETLLSSAQGIVDGFADYFKSVFVSNGEDSDVGCSDSICDTTLFCDVLHLFSVNVPDLRMACKNLKPSFTMGSDQIPSFLVKDCLNCFEDVLCFIMNLIVETGVYPDLWRCSKICPVFKSGNKSIVSNYRPIAIIPNFAKLFERIIASHLYSHVAKFIPAHQHGFVKGRSTVTNLAVFTQRISDALEAKSQVDVVFTDFSKAFDQVQHRIVLDKLKNVGVCDGLMRLFFSMLTNRWQYVEYHGVKSYMYEVTSGVNQGSNLGPILFLIFVSDLSKHISSEVLMYADDLKLMKVVKCIDDCLSLQLNLDALCDWCSRNMLNLNIKKCEAMSFFRIRSCIEYPYSINGVVLNRCHNKKDLGVVFDRELNFIKHYEHLSSKCYKMLGFIIRNTKSFKSIDCLKLLFYAFIRSHLEYACVVWNPRYQTHVSSIESIQRKFLKYLYLVKFGAYPVRGYAYTCLINEFQLEPLYVRRQIASVLYLHRIVHCKIDCSELVEMLKFRIPKLGIRYSATFCNQLSSTNYHQNSPIIAMCTLYNQLQLFADIFEYHAGTFRRRILYRMTEEKLLTLYLTYFLSDLNE